ncbi:MAG: HEAT repeat domain-containing protein [Planctomycetota bacterium]
MKRPHAALLALLAPLALTGTLLWTSAGTPAAPATVETNLVRTELGAAHAGAGVAAGDRESAVVRDGVCWAPVGTRLVFALDSRIELTTEGKDEGGSPRRESTNLVTRGHLSVTVVAREGRDLLASVTSDDLAVELPEGSTLPTELAANLAAFEEPTLVRMDNDGRIHGYRFPRSLDSAQRDFVRGIVGGFAFVAFDDQQREWSASGADSAGEFEARYRRESNDGAPLEVVREKLRYTAVRDHERMQVTTSGSARARFDGDSIGWLVAARLDETTHVGTDMMPVEFHVGNRSTLELVSHAQVAVELAADPFGDSFASASGHTEDPAAVAAASLEAEWRTKLRGKNAGTVVREMMEEFLAGRDDSRELMERWEELSWLVKLDPQALESIRHMLLDGTLDPKLHGLMLSALAKAGTPEAQSTMLSTYGDATAPLQLRGAAAAAMFDVVAPTAELLSGVASRVGQLTTVDPADATAVLALGAMEGRNAGPTAGEGNATLAIAAWRGRAKDLDAEDLWLDAMGNAKAPGLEEAAREAIEDPREHVRDAGIRALAQVAGSNAFESLVRIVWDHREPMARATALTSLATRSEPAVVEVLLVAAETDVDSFVRQTALTTLARRGSEGVDRSRIQRIAETDTDDQVKAVALRMLGGA